METLLKIPMQDVIKSHLDYFTGCPNVTKTAVEIIDIFEDVRFKNISCAKSLKEDVFSASNINKRTKQSRIDNIVCDSYADHKSDVCVDLMKTRQSKETQTSPMSSSIPNVKSGNLVMICPHHQRIWNQLPRSRSFSTLDHSCGLLPLRYPVIVQVYRSRNEHFVVIRRTRRRQTEKPLILNITNNSFVLSESASSRLTVYPSGLDGKSFTFEASCPDVAKDWVLAFTPTHPSFCSELKKSSTFRRPLAGVDEVNSIIQEENEEDIDSTTTSDAQKDIENISQRIHNRLTEAKHPINKDVFLSNPSHPSHNFSHSMLFTDSPKEDLSRSRNIRSTINRNNHKLSRVTDVTSLSQFSDSDNCLPHSNKDFANILRTLSLPVLYEYEEDIKED